MSRIRRKPERPNSRVPKSKTQNQESKAAPPSQPAGAAPSDLSARLDAAAGERLLAHLSNPELSPENTARLVNAYANLTRAASGRRRHERADAAARPAEPPPAEPRQDPRGFPASEVTYWRGRPAPRRLRGHHPGAPYGRQPDGTPYTQDEFVAAFREACQFAWGIDPARRRPAPPASARPPDPAGPRDAAPPPGAPEAAAAAPSAKAATPPPPDRAADPRPPPP